MPAWDYTRQGTSVGSNPVRNVSIKGMCCVGGGDARLWRQPASEGSLSPLFELYIMLLWGNSDQRTV